MRVYLACTVRGSRLAIDTARHIRDVLESLGHTVLTGHLLEDDVDLAESALADGAIFERDVEWLEQADVLVAEASGSSFGVGFEVGYTLARAPETGKRVLLLYDASRRDAISRMIAGNTSPYCRVLGYRSAGEIDAFLREQVG
jgi:nucleoside 2-deoxyribosyltransferase